MKAEKKNSFLLPKLKTESENINRICGKLNISPSKAHKAFSKGEIILLDRKKNLLFCDMYDVNCLEDLEKIANKNNKDLNNLLLKLSKNQRIDCPLVLEFNEEIYLVSGNLRCCLSKLFSSDLFVYIIRI